MSDITATQISNDIIRQIREEPRLKKSGRFSSSKTQSPVQLSDQGSTKTESAVHPALVVVLGILSVIVGLLTTLVVASYVRL